MIRTDRFGVRGALVLLGAFPVLVASVALGWIALLTHRDASASLAKADAVRRFELISQTVSVFDGELAVMDAWSRTSELSAADTSDLIGLWVGTTTNAADRSWGELSDRVADIDPMAVELLGGVRDELLVYRTDYAEGRPDLVAATIDAARQRLADVTALLAAEARSELGASGSVLVELVELQTSLTDQAVREASAVLTGVGSVAQRESLVVARTRSELALERVRRELGNERRDDFERILASEERAAWDDLSGLLLDADPDQAADLGPDEVLALILEGTTFVRTVDLFREDVFDSISAAARADGEAVMRRRDVIVVAAVAALGVAVVGASAIGRDVAGRIRRVSDVAEQVSAGELDLEPLRPGGSDEVSRLARAMDEMVVTLRGVNDQIDALAAGRSDDPSLAEELPGTVGRSLRGAIERLGRSTEELKRQATHDSLTGLLDRHGLDQLIETVDEARSTDVGVVLLDLDGFKEVNDAHGHQMGDELLRGVAARLGDVARSSDVVARLGGDEFVVLLLPEADAAVAEQVSDRIVDGVCEPIVVEGVTLRVGASVGWVVATPGTPLSVALRQADAAMYEAKRAGKGRAVRAERV